MDQCDAMTVAFKQNKTLECLSFKWMTIAIVSVLMSIFAQGSLAKVSLKPFESDSLSKVEQTREGEAFVVVLWSIDCPPCIKELKLLSKFKTSGLLTRFILVSTDGEEYRDELERLIYAEQLSGYEHWLFNDALPERLRYKIDPLWYGELPRSYFYDEHGERIPHSGVLTEEILQAWLMQYLHSNQLSK